MKFARSRNFACAALLLLGLVAPAIADVFRPAYLELRETAPNRYAVVWKVPAQGEQRLAVHVVFPAGTLQLTPPRGTWTDGAYVEQWEVERASGFTGEPIGIGGIATGVTDVIVRVERSDGTEQMERVLPSAPTFAIKNSSSRAQVAASYFVLGVQHILGGVDHLLFVLALLLIVRGGRRIFATITAFTLAHSITLVSATLGWVHVPGPPVEAMIALSIAFVAAEIVHGLRGKPGLTARAPWIVAFSFGLLHGFGFAGALAEVGLPPKALPIALFTFNLGVEMGQLLFVAAFFAVRRLLEHARLPKRAWMPYAVPYAIGAVAMFWVVQRSSQSRSALPSLVEQSPRAGVDKTSQP